MQMLRDLQNKLPLSLQSADRVSYVLDKCIVFSVLTLAALSSFWLSGSHFMLGAFLVFWGLQYLWTNDPIQTNGTEKPFWLLAAVYILAIVFSTNPKASVVVLENLIPFTYVFLLGNISLLRPQKKLLLNIWLVLFMVHSLFVIGQYFYGIVRPGGTYEFMSFTHVILVPLSTSIALWGCRAGKSLGILSISVTVVVGIALYATMTRGGWLAFIFAVFLFLVIQKKWRVLLLTLIIILVIGTITLAAFPKSHASIAIKSTIMPFDKEGSNRVKVSNYDRLYMWEGSIKMALDHPLFGVGPEMFCREYEKYRERDVDIRILRGRPSHAHSMYFDNLAQTGFVGLTALLIFLGSLFKALIRRYKKTNAEFEKTLALGAIIALVCFCVGGLTYQSFHRTMVTLNLSFIIGLALAPDYSRKDLAASKV